MMQHGRADRASIGAMTLAGPELARVFQKGMAGEPEHTGEEFNQWTLICRATFLSGEDSFLQHKAGLLDKPAFDSFVTGAHSFFASPGLRAMWRLSSGQYGGEFREFITLIVDQTPVARDADTFPSGGNYCNWKRGL
jgi:hypothetical protein